MASVLYPTFKQKLLEGALDLTSLDVRFMLIDVADEAYNAADEFKDDVTAGGIIATSAALTGKTVTSGVFDATSPVTLSGVSGDQFEAVIFYQHTGVDATSALICFVDSGTGLPFTPSGGDIEVTFDAGANKIFAL